MNKVIYSNLGHLWEPVSCPIKGKRRRDGRSREGIEDVLKKTGDGDRGLRDATGQDTRKDVKVQAFRYV